jgi:mRNA interferase HigB
VDKVGQVFVFNVGGNKLRLVAAVHFNVGKVFVRHVLSHAEYDRGTWKYREGIQ